MSAPVPAPPRPTVPVAAGDVPSNWRWLLTIGWTLIVTALFVVAGAADVINRPTWWLGEYTDTQPVYVLLLPFVAPFTTIAIGLTGRRGVWQTSALASLSTAVVAVIDRTDSPSAAIVTGALAAAGGLLTAAAWGARVRRLPADDRSS